MKASDLNSWCKLGLMLTVNRNNRHAFFRGHWETVGMKGGHSPPFYLSLAFLGSDRVISLMVCTSLAFSLHFLCLFPACLIVSMFPQWL